MKRLAAVLVLMAQLFAILAPGSTVWCVDDAGRAALELAGSACCRAAHRAEVCARAADDSSPGARVRSPVDRCRDFPVRSDSAPVARSADRPQMTQSSERIAPVAIVLWSAPQPFLRDRSERTSFHGPPPDAVPRRERRFVLRC